MMEDKLGIYVPSRNRADWLTTRKRHTLKIVDHMMNVHLVVRPDDPQHEAYEKMAEKHNAVLVDQRLPALGAGQAYDFCIEHAIAHGFEYMYILNDDSGLQTIDVRRLPEIKYVQCSRPVIEYMFDSLTRVLGMDVPAATFISMMRRGHAERERLAFCKPLMGAYCLYVPFFREHPEFRFWVGTRDAEAYCDYNLTLRLLTSGYLTCYFTSLIIDTALNNPGGCSEYRSLELEEQGMQYILDHYPKFARPSVAKNWGGGVERKSATIQWKKAFDREAFIRSFGYDPSDTATDLENEQMYLYAKLIEQVKSGEVPMACEEDPQ